MPRIVFVTGKLAEPSLRKTLAELAPQVGFEADVAVMPITVAALMTTDWIGRRWRIPRDADRVILPGACRGSLDAIPRDGSAEVHRGPADLRDLPEYFGTQGNRREDYGAYDIDILAEINHAPSMSGTELSAVARRYQSSGADVIDLGCDPGGPWSGTADAVRRLRDDGMRVSIDSFDASEVEAALSAGAELVLSVNSTNSRFARGWFERYGSEVVAIPDTPTDVDSLDRTTAVLSEAGVPFRIDLILEPIGFGFAESLGRYVDARRRHPDIPMMMGVGNLTELTDVDSAGINVLLAGFCQELGIRSVLTTEVINWCRTSVREFDLARRLVHYAARKRTLPKRIEPNLVMFRDPKLRESGAEGLAALADAITDRNYRLFAERGEIHVINGSAYLKGTDPFALFAEMLRIDPKLDPSHAFYLGYEMAKAVTALTLGKNYVQDQALRWGFLTVPEISHRGEAGPVSEDRPE